MVPRHHLAAACSRWRPRYITFKSEVSRPLRLCVSRTEIGGTDAQGPS